MTELVIKSDHPEAVRTELQAALDGQRRILQESIKRTQERLTAFEEKYGFTTPMLLRRASHSSFDDSNLEQIEWIGESKLLERLQAELALIDDIKICT